MLNYAALTSAESPFYESGNPIPTEAYFSDSFLAPSDEVYRTPHWHYVNNHLIERGVGWKIHVAAVPSNAQSILDKVGAFCCAEGIAFKYIPDRRTFLARNSKYADLGSAGKFITLYPHPRQFDSVANALTSMLHECEGPGIPMDIPSGRGPVSYRYGAIIDASRIDMWGQAHPGAYDPHNEWVPDPRTFRSIEEIDDYVPTTVHDAYGSLASNTTALPFEPRGVLHRSNAGGVYEANFNDARVVVKEARPFAGIDGLGHDAIYRLRNEWKALTAVAEVHGVVNPVELVQHQNHLFLVEEFISGDDLYTYAAKNFPFYTEGSSAAYAKTAFEIVASCEKTLKEAHAVGVYLGDIQARNIILSESGEPIFIDAESAAFGSMDSAHPIATPGTFLPGVLDAQRYDAASLALLLLDLLHPSTPLMHRDPRINRHRLSSIERMFGHQCSHAVAAKMEQLSKDAHASIL